MTHNVIEGSLVRKNVVVKNVVKSRDCGIPKWRPPLKSDMFQVLIDICNEPFVRHTVCRIRNVKHHGLTLEFEWYHLIPLKLFNWCHWSIFLSWNWIQNFFCQWYVVYMVWESWDMSDFWGTLRVSQEFLYHNLVSLNIVLMRCCTRGDYPRCGCNYDRHIYVFTVEPTN